MCLLYDICVVLIFGTYPFVFFRSDMLSISSRLFLSRFLPVLPAQSQSLLGKQADALNNSLLT